MSRSNKASSPFAHSGRADRPPNATRDRMSQTKIVLPPPNHVGPTSATCLSPRPTLAVILEYCGGSHTDGLHRELVSWNPDYDIAVLDNGSPENAAQCVTHKNADNSFTGGGIRDCLAMAERSGRQFLFLVTNDIHLRSEVYIARFEHVLLRDPAVVQVSAAVVPSSAHARVFPWMRQRAGQRAFRRVPHSDFLCTLVRCDFVRQFGGFPHSRGGWGFDLELAIQARRQGKVIVVDDRTAIDHTGDQTMARKAMGPHFDKAKEMLDVYQSRYGNIQEEASNVFGSVLLELGESGDAYSDRRTIR